MTLTVLNPATEEPIAELEQAGRGGGGRGGRAGTRRLSRLERRYSGFGRELGMQALDGYSEVKSVFISTEG